MSVRKAGLRLAARLWKRFRPPPEPRDCIVVYHSVHSSLPFRSCSPDEFQHHLEWLTNHCDLVHVAELLQPRPNSSVRPRVAITFDDGYADNYEYAFPLLVEYKAPATFFVAAGYVDRDPVVLARFQKLRRTSLAELDPLTWGQLAEMSAAGMDIGCHTYSHPSLNHLADLDAKTEMTRSKQLIEDRLGRAVIAHAYPFGKPGCTIGLREVRTAEHLDYEYAVTTVRQGLRPDNSPWQLPRLIVGAYPLQELIAGLWDYIGVYNERAPIWLARTLSPKGFRASTYGGSYTDMGHTTRGDGP